MCLSMRKFRKQYPRSFREDIVHEYLTGDKTTRELSDYYKIPESNVRVWVTRYRPKKDVSLQREPQIWEYMAQKKVSTESGKCLLSQDN